MTQHDLVKSRLEALIGEILGVRSVVSFSEGKPLWLRIKFREPMAEKSDLVQQCVGLVRTQLALWAMYPSSNPIPVEDLFIRLDDFGPSNLEWWKERSSKPLT